MRFFHTAKEIVDEFVDSSALMKLSEDKMYSLVSNKGELFETRVTLGDICAQSDFIITPLSKNIAVNTRRINDITIAQNGMNFEVRVFVDDVPYLIYDGDDREMARSIYNYAVSARKI